MDSRYQSPMFFGGTSVQSPSALSDDDDAMVASKFAFPSTFPIPIPEKQDQNSYWCSIAYYELNSRVGEGFKISSAQVTVDGGVDPSNGEERICLGIFQNVNRNNTIESTRRHIGRGVRFSCVDFQVIAFNLSDASVFIQSRNANFKHNLQSTAVCRVPSNGSIVVFDYQLFSNV